MTKVVYLKNDKTGGVIRLAGHSANKVVLDILCKEGYRVVGRDEYHNALKRIDWSNETSSKGR